MSYTPTSWHKGDKVTTERLNKIEQGIVDAEQSGSSLPDYSQANDGDVLSIESGAPVWKEPSGSVFIVRLNVSTATFDKTWQEIHDALSDKAVLAVAEVTDVMGGNISSPVVAATHSGEEYAVMIIAMTGSGLGMQIALTDAADGYPVLQS